MILVVSSTLNYLILLKPYFPLAMGMYQQAQSKLSINKAVLDAHGKPTEYGNRITLRL